MFVFVLFLSACKGIAREGTAKSIDAPAIRFDHERIDLGIVKEGVGVHCSFRLKNIGSKTLEIYDIYASCGCTAPSIEKQSLAPSESTQLDVLIDTSMKQDKVTKTVDVSSNDPDRPIVILNISMEIENPHKNLSETGKAKILVDEKCTGCHVLQGVGTFGRELYEADCAMCHGNKAEGAVGPRLTVGDYNNATYAKHIRDVIAHGSKQHRSMPGFEVTVGGPLSPEQIDSLLSYLGKLTKSKR